MTSTASDTIVSVTVKYENEEAPAHQLWVSMLDVDQMEITKRRSVILRSGLNKITLTWRIDVEAFAAFAALYLNRVERHPWAISEIRNASTLKSGDIVTLDWNITFTEPMHVVDR